MTKEPQAWDLKNPKSLREKDAFRFKYNSKIGSLKNPRREKDV